MKQKAHPILAGLDEAWPALLGFNEVRPKSGANVLATVSADYGEKPLLVAGDFGRGRTLAWTSDIGPHWLPPEFAAWTGYARLWRQALEWLVRARDRDVGMIHVVGNAAIDTLIRVDTLSAAGRDDRCARARPRISAARASTGGGRLRAADRKVRLVAAIGARRDRRADPDELAAEGVRL